MTMEELSNVQGRAWEDVDVSAAVFMGFKQSLTINSIDGTTNGGMRKETVDAVCCILLSLPHVVQCSDHILMFLSIKPIINPLLSL